MEIVKSWTAVFHELLVGELGAEATPYDWFFESCTLSFRLLYYGLPRFSHTHRVYITYNAEATNKKIATAQIQYQTNGEKVEK